GEVNPVLVRALADRQPAVRATVAEALVKGAGPQAYAAVRKLLPDPTPTVRLRVAFALARARERDGVPVLIDLLTALPEEQLGQVEDALYQLAGEAAPEVAVGTKAEERKKCRDAWAAWWKANADSADLARLTARPWFGYTLVVDCQGNRVYELDR